MHKHIKNAIVYKAEMPTAKQLAKHLAELPYSPIGETMLACASFVPNKVSNELVTEFEGGYAFTLRYDEKILPKGIVRERANERIKQVEQAAGHRLKKIERVAIAEQVLVDLARTALVKTAIITAFYSTKDQLLIVPVGSKNLANIVTSRLVHVVGSLKTSTIHISNIKNGLTTRLKKHAEGVDPACFDGFEVGASVALKKESQKVSYSIADLDTASQGLLEAIERGFEVERLALEHNGVEFKLTSDFHFKAVKFADDAEHDAADERDEVFMWRQDAAAQVLMFSCVLNQLCDLLGYKADEDEQAEQAAEA